MIHTLRRRTFAIALSLSLLITSLIINNPANAALHSTRSATNAVSTTAWGAYLVPAGSNSSPGPYVNTWTPTNSLQLEYLDLINPNMVALSGAQFSFASVEPNSSRQNVPRITFDVCEGAVWNPIANTCAGTVTSLGTSTGGSLTSTVSVLSQSRISIRLTVNKVGKLAWTTTINTIITRAQVRAAAISNS